MEMGGGVNVCVEEHSWLAFALLNNTEDFIEHFVWDTSLAINI